MIKHKLKYLNLFEELSQREDNSILNKVSISNTKTKYTDSFDDVRKIKGVLYISNNENLEQVNAFKKLEYIDSVLSIQNNDRLNTIQGFDKLKRIGWELAIKYNPVLIYLSIPSNIIWSVNYREWHILLEDEYKFKSPTKFVNSSRVITDCIEKFNPGIHGDVVVTQILENVETWGTPKTQETIINHLLSKGNYLEYIPESMEHLVEEHYKHMYDPKYNNTGAKSVAKVATGITYGLF